MEKQQLIGKTINFIPKDLEYGNHSRDFIIQKRGSNLILISDDEDKIEEILSFDQILEIYSKQNPK